MAKSDHLGPPDLALAGFQLWVHGWENPDADDYWDGNWLRVTAHCGAQGANVWVTGSLIHLREIAAWLTECRRIMAVLKGEATLDCMEPALRIELRMLQLGHVAMTVSITPDHMHQRHEFDFELDQSYLPRLVADCQKMLAAYPMRGRPRE